MFDPDYDLFVHIIQAGSISAAARARGASVAGLSKRLSRLEERLGVGLIHRTTRRLALTVPGKELYDALLLLGASLEGVEDRISGRHADASGPLRLTAPTSFGRMHVVPHLPAFLERYPQIDLQIDLSDEFVDLREGGHDVAIRIAATIDLQLVSYRLGTSRRVLCAAPGYLARFGVPQTLADLKHHRLLATESQLPWHLEGSDGQVVQDGCSHVRTNSSEVVRELALEGCGIALRSLWDVSAALAGGKLVQVLPDYQGSQEVGIFAVHLPGPVVPARFRLFIEHLKENSGGFTF
ncbi:LysR family transcriptional regulator [Novosphingobium colocasiae]|nr:LysR family transcriptional regulator [Novosphingobium colocasiae]